MKFSSLELMCCPECCQSLVLGAAQRGQRIETGRLRCLGCSKTYPIQKGIPRFAPRRELVGKNKIAYWVENIDSLFYDQTVKVMGSLLEVEEEEGRREYLSRLEVVKGAKILEVAVGPGPNLPYLHRMFEDARMFGVDLSVGMMRQCARNLKRWSLEAELFQGLAERLPFKDDVFDVVFQVGGINNFRDKKRAIGEMFRVAKPGTKIIVVDEWLHPEQARRPIVRLILKTVPFLYRNTDPPADQVPDAAVDKTVRTIWNGYGYCLELRKPAVTVEEGALS